MAWQRKIPFGYTMKNGETLCCPTESAIVKEIFRLYSAGMAYSKIADEMMLRGIPYHKHTSQWNKHMVKRILENERYLGEKEYPPIIEPAIFMNVQLIKGDKNTYTPCPDYIKPIREKVVCGVCGGRMLRDLVITKSVSRFCRNTLDGLDYVRKLKRMGVGVFFEKENVNTLYMDNEMILTFMMSQAQAESESMSGNIRWGHRKNFKDGKVYYHYAGFLGYRKGEDDLPEIDTEEAEIVRRIFSRYLVGHSVAKIIADLEADGIKTVRGHKKWNDGVIRGMLKNEKYIGDALLQKTYIADLFTRQSKKNNGELPQYYVHDCHPAIIDKLTFQRVQEEMARRSSLRKVSTTAKTELAKYSGKYVLTELLSCGDCGSPYRRVTWTRPEGKKIVWRCINRLENGKKFCKDAPTLEESRIHAAVVSAMNEMFSLKTMKALLQDSILSALSEKGGETSIAAIDGRLSELRNQQYELLQLAASVGVNSTQYDEELNKISMEFSALIAKRNELEKNQKDIAQADKRAEQIAAGLDTVDTGITGFDEVAVRQLISAVRVLSEDKLLIRFRDGTEIEQII